MCGIVVVSLEGYDYMNGSAMNMILNILELLLYELKALTRNYEKLASFQMVRIYNVFTLVQNMFRLKTTIFKIPIG